VCKYDIPLIYKLFIYGSRKDIIHSAIEITKFLKHIGSKTDIRLMCMDELLFKRGQLFKYILVYCHIEFINFLHWLRIDTDPIQQMHPAMAVKSLDLGARFNCI